MADKGSSSGRRWLRRVGIAALCLIIAVPAVAGVALWWAHGAFDRDMRKVERAGYTEHDAMVDGAKIHYAVSPANDKPPLLLIHGQGMDWRGYAKTLPALAKDFRVYAVDVFGHGQSEDDPELYSVVAHGEKLVQFIDEVIGEPTFISGHSSGGILTAWVSANAPELIRGTLLEDPPHFTTRFPRARTTWNYVDLATACHNYLESDETDWVAYSWEHQRIWKFFGDAAQSFIDEGLKHHERHPDEGIRVWWAPQFNRGNDLMLNYDPRFGDAFYTGNWNHGFDEDATLRAQPKPTTLVHTKVQYDDDGTLMAAMSDREALRARMTIPDVEFVKVETGHEFHEEDPKLFVELLKDLAARED